MGGGGGDNAAAAAEAMTLYASTMRHSLSSTSHHTMLTQRRTQPCEPECCVKRSRDGAQIMVGLPASYITSAATMLATHIVCLSQPVTELCVFTGGAMVLLSYLSLFPEGKKERNTKD